MQILSTIITVLFLLVSVALIVLVLMQEGKSAGLSGAIAGGAETFFGKKRAKSYEGKLALFTKIGVGAFVTLAIILVIIQ